MKRMSIVAVFTALAFAAPAMAEGHGRGNFVVPPGPRPAARMCRIWIDGVPRERQPGPMDCATAQARVPRNGRIIYDDHRPDGRIVTRADRRDDRRFDQRFDRRDADWKKHKQKKHKHDKHDDHHEHDGRFRR